MKVKPAELVNRCLLAKLSVSCFVGNPRDKELTAEVESDKNTEHKRLSVRKRIMQGKELNACLTTAQALRKEFETLSLPWFDGGFRLIPSVKFIETKQALDKRIEAFDTAVADFLRCYDSIIARDRIALGATFNASDYPSQAELRGKFSARLECSPLPIANKDWRVAGIDSQIAATIAKQVEEQTEQRLAVGKAELLNRAKEEIKHLAERLADAEKRFKENSIANVIDAANAIEGLNVTEDGKLSKLSKEIAGSFGKLNADGIREDKQQRETALETCQAALADIEKTMDGLF